MAKDPAFLFYSSDFLTGTADMTNEEKGQYITLLCLQHQKGRLSKKAVAVAVPNATADVMAKFRQDNNGFFYNERLEKEAQKRAEHSQKQKERALKGWEKRRAAANAVALPLENENENRIEIKTDKGVEIFELICQEFGITDMMPQDIEYVTNYIARIENRSEKRDLYYFCERIKAYFENTSPEWYGNIDTFLVDPALMSGRWNKGKYSQQKQSQEDKLKEAERILDQAS